MFYSFLTATRNLVNSGLLPPIASLAGYLGETGIRVLTRMMGLLLMAMAVQFMLNGLTDIGLVKEFAVRAYGGAWLISRPQHGVAVDAPEVQRRLRGEMKLKGSTWHIYEIL